MGKEDFGSHGNDHGTSFLSLLLVFLFFFCSCCLGFWKFMGFLVGCLIFWGGG